MGSLSAVSGHRLGLSTALRRLSHTRRQRRWSSVAGSEMEERTNLAERVSTFGGLGGRGGRSVVGGNSEVTLLPKQAPKASRSWPLRRGRVPAARPFAASLLCLRLGGGADGDASSPLPPVERSST